MSANARKTEKKALRL